MSLSYVPTAHIVHGPELPALVYVPATQFTHAVNGLLSASLVPAGHVVHTRFDVGVGSTFSYCPAVQIVE